MPGKFAILHMEKITDWGDFSRLVNHCEREGQKLPSNIAPNRQGNNALFHPQAAGAAAAIARWHLRVGKRESASLTEADLRNIPALAYRLQNADRARRPDAFAKFILANLSQKALTPLPFTKAPDATKSRLNRLF